MIPNRSHKCAALLIFLMLALIAFAHQEPAENTKIPGASPSAGERLVYKILWDPPWYLIFLPKMEAGEVALELIPGVDHEGRKAHKIVMTAISSGSLARISGMKVEDEFVFYTDPETLCTMSASQKIREGKRKRQIDVEYFRETRQLRIREVDEAPVPPKVRKDETKNDIPECVHDPLSAMYMFRQLPLGERFSRVIVIANDDKVREVRGSVEKRETIDTAIGKLAAWKINTTAMTGGLFREGGQFQVWLTADEKKIPVQFEVKVRLGRVSGKLKTAK